MFAKFLEWIKYLNNKIKLGFFSTKTHTALITIGMIGLVYYAIKVNLEKAGTFKMVIVTLLFSIGSVYLIEKFVFPGWSINQFIKTLFLSLNEFIQGAKDGKTSAGLALLAIAVVCGLLLLSIAIFSSAVISKFIPSF